jgi:nucleotide-binding universal stress UspA family protein
MYNKILAPLDGSSFSECSLAHVKEIASGCHVGKVVLFTAIKPIYIIGEMWSTSPKQVEKLNADLQEEEEDRAENAQNYLAKKADDLNKSGIETEIVILKNKQKYEVAESILNYAEENHIDLIVMSTHGRSGPSRWALGSITDRVVRYSKVPVLTVAPAGCRL